jgi:hypothetical protein
MMDLKAIVENEEFECTLKDIINLSINTPCFIFEMKEGKTLYCFGKHLFNTYKDVIIVDSSNKDNCRFFQYHKKIKINRKQLIYVINKK